MGVQQFGTASVSCGMSFFDSTTTKAEFYLGSNQAQRQIYYHCDSPNN